LPESRFLKKEDGAESEPAMIGWHLACAGKLIYSIDLRLLQLVRGSSAEISPCCVRPGRQAGQQNSWAVLYVLSAAPHDHKEHIRPKQNERQTNQ
jgi:hypothetical protein